MSSGKLYSAEEARALREHPVLNVCADCGEKWPDGSRRCDHCPSTRVRFVRHPVIVDLAATVEHLSAEVAFQTEQHRIWCERATAEDRRRLDEVARITRERDNALAHAQHVVRILSGVGTPEDVVALLTSILLDNANDAPNCAEWGGEYAGRNFAVSVQWRDGKSPHAMIDEAQRERDAAVAQTEELTRDLETLRGAVRACLDASDRIAALAHHPELASLAVITAGEALDDLRARVTPAVTP